MQNILDVGLRRARIESLPLGTLILVVAFAAILRGTGRCLLDFVDSRLFRELVAGSFGGVAQNS